MPLLEVHQLSQKISPDFQLKNISFSLEKGSILGVSGKNGHGKSSLIKLIAGLTEPDKGHILLNEEKILGPAYKLVPGYKEIKVISDQADYSEQLTVKDNLLHQLKGYTPDSSEERVQLVSEICQITHLHSSRPRELSAGERQKLALAYALVEMPELLLLDEPFVNLDFVNTHNILALIKEVVAELQIGVIFVAHDPQSTLSLCDHLLIMQDGAFLEEGSPESIYRTPKHLYTATLFGELNIIDDKWVRPEKVLLIPGEEDEITSFQFCGFYYRVITRNGVICYSQEKPQLNSKVKVEFL